MKIKNMVRKVELLIRGGIVFDGTGGAPFAAHVGTSGDKIVYIGTEEPHADKILEADGLSVCPGFIDAHSHSDFTLLADRRAAFGKLSQGVTTEINGNCGLSGGPMFREAREQREADLREYAISERWETLGEYLRLLEARGLAMNFATLVGQGSLRASVMGYADRPATYPEMEKMKALLADSLRSGALGMSTGLIYPPGTYTETSELIALAAFGKRIFDGFVYASHMRSEGARLIEAVREALAIGSAAGKVNISHIKTSGRENWGKIEAAIGEIETARAAGLNATADRYPYTAAATDLDAVLPAWAFEGGSARELQRLKDPEDSRRIRSELEDAEKADPGRWTRIYISGGGDACQWAEGRNIAEIASRLGLSPIDAIFKLLIDSGLRADAIFHSMSEENLDKFYALPWVMVGSDSSARSFSGITSKRKPHPRTFGTFPRYLKRYRMKERGETDLRELARAVRQVTALPASVFGLKKRGLIKEGYYADITVFDPKRFEDRATFDEPNRSAEGLRQVIVNGRPALGDPGEFAPSGRVLRSGG